MFNPMKFLGVISICFGLLTGANILVADEPTTASAEKAVDGYISSLLADMEQIKSLYATDKPAYFAKVEEALSEFVDFSEVARGVIAKYGTGPNGASVEQMARFSEVFRASLVDFYGSALANYGGVNFAIIPATTQPADPASSTNVRMSIESDDGSRFEVQYTMFLNADGMWKLKNLFIEGVNLRRQYYAQFDSLMMRNNYDIDKVIDSWAVNN